MPLMHQEDVIGDTYVGFIHVIEGDDEGIRCNRCRQRMFESKLLMSFDGSGEHSSFEDVTVCESCLMEMCSMASPRATLQVLNDPSSSQTFVEWTEIVLDPSECFRGAGKTVAVRFDWDVGVHCDRCKSFQVAIPVLEFDGTGGLCDSLSVCGTCLHDLLSIGRSRMLSRSLETFSLGFSA